MVSQINPEDMSHCVGSTRINLVSLFVCISLCMISSENCSPVKLWTQKAFSVMCNLAMFSVS